MLLILISAPKLKLIIGIVNFHFTDKLILKNNSFTGVAF